MSIEQRGYTPPERREEGAIKRQFDAATKLEMFLAEAEGRLPANNEEIAPPAEAPELFGARYGEDHKDDSEQESAHPDVARIQGMIDRLKKARYFGAGESATVEETPEGDIRISTVLNREVSRANANTMDDLLYLSLVAGGLEVEVLPNIVEGAGGAEVEGLEYDAADATE